MVFFAAREPDCLKAFKPSNMESMGRLQLTPEHLLAAYSQGIFPMGVDGEIRWFSPDPRAIIPLDGFHAPRTLRQRWRQQIFDIRVNTAFDEVMRNCGNRAEGTWITDEILNSYQELHELGFAHSVEAWKDEKLAGGLYGVSIGGAFFGESMFHRVTDASKIALMALVERLHERKFVLLDTQFRTGHLDRFGAVEIQRDEYLVRLAEAIHLDRRFADGAMSTCRPRTTKQQRPKR